MCVRACVRACVCVCEHIFVPGIQGSVKSSAHKMSHMHKIKKYRVILYHWKEQILESCFTAI